MELRSQPSAAGLLRADSNRETSSDATKSIPEALGDRIRTPDITDRYRTISERTTLIPESSPLETLLMRVVSCRMHARVHPPFLWAIRCQDGAPFVVLPASTRSNEF